MLVSLWDHRRGLRRGDIKVQKEKTPPSESLKGVFYEEEMASTDPFRWENFLDKAQNLGR